jgi:GH24 family phage-related lysozyme (muramidase)
MIKRTQIAALSLSAAALVGIALHEGYSDKAYVPVPGDRPTVGFGSTFDESGKPVQMGDTITPPEAIARTLAHIQKDERGIKTCVTAPLTQAEYDLMVDFSYQYGTQTLCKSSIVSHANAGRYRQSCDSYLLYKRVAGYDCSTPGNTRCSGVWKRSQERHRKCMEAQQ